MSFLSRTGTVIAAAALALGLVHPVATAQPVTPPPAPAAHDPKPAAATEAEAIRQARQTGQSVEIQDKNTQTSQIKANPDGSFTLRSNARPVRVKKDGEWRGIDTTLRAGPDGSLTPVAAATDIRFSGGGTGPFVRVADGAAAVSVSWPAPLPTPAVSGNTATYREVLPGVDLKLIADSDTYTQVLVVRDADAAKNPALAAIKLNVSATNLTLRAAADGTLSAVAKSGEVMFVQSTPRMWDSTRDDRIGPAPTAMFSGSGKVSQLSTTVTPRGMAAKDGTGGHPAVDVALIPDPAALVGPGVTYPLYIDPYFARHRSQWAEVLSNGWTPKYNGPDPVRVGRCYNRDGHCGGTWTARSFFSVGVWDLMPRANGARPRLFDTGYYVGQLHAANKCVEQPTTLWAANGFDAGIRWGGPTAYPLNTQWSNAGDQCGGGRAVKFDPGVLVQAAVDNAWSTINFGLLAPDEGNDLQWKVFDNNPLLEVSFSYPPNAATNLHVSNEVRCTGKVITPDAHPLLYATASDNNDPPLNPALWYHVWAADGSRQVGSGGGIRIGSGTEGAWREPDNLGDGDWRYSVYVDNNPGHPHNMNAGYSSWYHFTTRGVPPAVAPTINQSVDYPNGYWGAPSGAPGAIAVSAGTARHIVGYTYTFGGAGTQTVPAPTDCNYNRTFGTNGGWIPHSEAGTNWIPLPAGLSAGYHTLHVRSFDDAHNLSPESQPYTFYVAPNTGLSAQRLEAENLAFSQPAGQNRGLGPQPGTHIGWSGDTQLYFQGNAKGQSFTMSFTTSVEADYNLGIALTKARDFGRLTFELDGRSIGRQYSLTDPDQAFDMYNSVMLASHHPLGIRRLAPGTHTLTAKMTGTHSASLGDRYGAGVDYVTLARTTRYEAEESAQVTPAQPPGQNVPVVVQARGNFTPAWSQGAALAFEATEPNQSLDLVFRTPVEADYALGIALAKRSNHGQLRIAIDGTPLIRTDTTPWDGHDSFESGLLVYLPLGGAHLSAGQHKLTITVVGKNARSGGYQATVDYLTAVPVNNVTAASFSAAMNNDGISVDGTPADMDLGTGALSAQTLAAAGYAPGAVATVNGATFTMPTATSAGDNVIAIGQTIPFPTGHQVKATAVGLLVVSTCGQSPEATGTIRYTDNSTQDSRLPAVHDWAYAPTDNATFVLPYRNLGAGVQSDIRPRVSALFVPVDPTKTLKSITLPNYGTNLLPGSCSPALHVLAMAPRPVTAGWLGTWTASADTARPTPGGVGFANQTLRTVIKPTITGSTVRVRLDNPHTNAPVTIAAASVAAQTGTGPATLAPPVQLTFGGRPGITLPAGGEAVSDPIAYPATTGGTGNLSVSLHFPTAVPETPIHSTPNNTREPTLLANGNATADTTGTPFTVLLGGSRYLSRIDVSTSNTTHGTVAVLGDQLTAVPPAAAGEHTWVPRLPAKLDAGGVPLPGGLVNASLAGQSPSGRWRLDDGSGTTARDSAGSSPATLTGGVTWSSERGGCVTLDGTGSLVTAVPIVATGSSYTVSAWVKLTADGAAQTVVSQHSGRTNGFALRYTGSTDNHKWAFTLPNNENNGSAAAKVLSTASIQSGQWTHLVGTYDLAGRTASLYVDGVYQGSAQQFTPFGTGRPFTIGRGQAEGVLIEPLKGSVSDVRAYQGHANGRDAGILFNGDPGTGPYPGLGAPTAQNADRSLNHTVLNQPGPRTVIVALGANDLLAGADVTSIKQDLTKVMHSTSPTGIRNTRRADGNPVRIVLTTIPALGLPAADPREQRRMELNADLLQNFDRYGANDIVDVATAVADPGNPSRINPEYLTSGETGWAYHNAVAATIADAVAGFRARL